MTIQEINQAYNRAAGSLDNKELKNAFDSLQSLIAGSGMYSSQDKLDELQDTYKSMLRYRTDGAQDPMQDQIYRNLQTSAYELADSLRIRLFDSDSSMLFYSTRRLMNAQMALTPFGNLYSELTKANNSGGEAVMENRQALLFSKIWLSGFLTEDDGNSVRSILEDSLLPYTVGSLVVSALFLGLTEFFDREKFLLLCDAFSLSSNEEIRIRAIIAILVILYMYRKRTALYPQIENRLAAMAERPGFTRLILNISLRFILSRETEKISRKLQEEIIPEMMKLNPKIGRKINPGQAAPELMGDDMNPEWQDLFANSELGKKIEEFGELQQEGADVMHSTFIHLKNFPFFKEISNWFIPFTAVHTSLRESRGTEMENGMISIMTESVFMCNSDKYSLYFSMMQLPESARKMMAGQFSSQATEMLQQSREELISKRGKAEIITGQYIQDLYRFFKLYPRRPDFKDIFNLPLDFHNLEILQPYISDEESLTTIAEYYLRKNYCDDALRLFERLAKTNHNSDILYQKIGYCKQMAGDMEGALDSYLRADLINTESKWVIRRIAGCYRTLKQPEEALEYYRRYEDLAPDNLSVQTSIGHCYLELKNYSEALKYYYKVDYLDAKNHKTWRPIAWCSFLTGKYDQARNYYKKILAAQPEAEDYLNAGHTEWALQNIKGAISFYKQAIQKENNDFSKFREQFMQDIPDLTLAGIEETEVPLMLDQLRYIMEN